MRQLKNKIVKKRNFMKSNHERHLKFRKRSKVREVLEFFFEDTLP